MKYLIAGTGGVGGCIAGFLALAGKDVACIARGEHLAAIREHGLRLHSDLKGEHTLHIQRLFNRFYYRLDTSCLQARNRCHSYIECIWDRSPHPASGARCNSVGRLHLHRRIRIRKRRNHADGQDIPSGLRGAQRHDCFP